MADLVITAANVLPSGGGIDAEGIAAVTITAGQSVYQDPNSGQIQLAKGDTAVHAAAVGVALHAALAGQPIRYRQSGGLALGAILTAGALYVVSAANPGGIAPNADMTAGNFVSVLGYASSTSVLQLAPIVTGTAHG
ncbi:MAG TPA: hypothetical protein VKS79_21205 [Gemmataceae bacterium]|nr:hypothetical protein [Gemmataceae bacterium]